MAGTLASLMWLSAYPVWTGPLTNWTGGSDWDFLSGGGIAALIYLIFAGRSVREEGRRAKVGHGRLEQRAAATVSRVTISGGGQRRRAAIDAVAATSMIGGEEPRSSTAAARRLGGQGIGTSGRPSPDQGHPRQGRRLLESLPYPENVGHHFVVDSAGFGFYAMDCDRPLGECSGLLGGAHDR